MQGTPLWRKKEMIAVAAHMKAPSKMGRFMPIHACRHICFGLITNKFLKVIMHAAICVFVSLPSGC
jgi:hypothetical protein